MRYIEDHMLESLAKHILTEIPLVANRENAHEDIARCFRLHREKEGRSMSTFIWFLRESPGGHSSILVTGDLCPRPSHSRGVISDLSYGIGWFSSKLSESYLCSKFMQEEWQADVASEWCEWEVGEIKKGENGQDLDDDQKQERIKQLEELKTHLGYADMDARQFYEKLQSISQYYVDDGPPGYDYPRGDAGWLCAIQQKFAELYEVMRPEPVEQLDPKG